MTHQNLGRFTKVSFTLIALLFVSANCQAREIGYYKGCNYTPGNYNNDYSPQYTCAKKTVLKTSEICKSPYLVLPDHYAIACEKDKENPNLTYGCVGGHYGAYSKWSYNEKEKSYLCTESS